MKINIDIPDELIGEAAKRELFSALRDHRGSDVTERIREAVTKQLAATDLVPLVDAQVRARLDDMIRDLVDSSLARKVKKAVKDRITVLEKAGELFAPSCEPGKAGSDGQL